MATSLFFDIFARDKGVTKTLDNIAGKADSVGGKLAGVAAGLGAAVGAGAFTVLKTGFNELKDSSAQTAQLEAGLKSTGNAAGTTVSDMSKLAEEIQKYSGQTDDSITNTESLLLTFTNIKNSGTDKIFDDTTRAAADMAAKLGGDASDQAIVLGKALNDPADGLSKLQRVGVTFSDEQVKTIKRLQETGDMAGAQKVILQELQTEFGGAAKAAGDSLPGKLAKGQRSFEDMSQKLTEALLPAILKLTEFLTDAATWVKENSGLVTNLGIGLGILAGGIAAATTMQWLWNIAAGANPIGAVILAVAALIAVIVLLAANWDNIVKFLTDVWNNFTKWWSDGMNKIGGQWTGFWDGIGTKIREVIDGVVNWFKETILPAFDKSLNGIKGFFEDTVKNIGDVWERLKETAAKPIRWVIETVINNGIVKGFNDFSGGLFGKDGPRLPNIPIGFATGGYTGDGGKYEPKGVVHGGEYVFTKEETQRAGVGTFRQLARVLRGYAEGGFVNPVDGGGTITQGFSGINGHNGLDIAGPLNTRIMAAFDGNVTSAGWSNMGGGNEIHIRHAGGWETWYAHLNQILVRAGQVVNRAATIGLMGSTGNSTGSHLHYMMMQGGWPNVVDPSPYMSGKVPAGGINPIAAILDGLIGSFRGAFPAAGLMVDLGVGVVQKLAGSVGPMVFDQGGWLDTVGVNRSGKPEAVLTPTQSDDFHRFVTNGMSMNIYVQNPWTGEYMLAQMDDRAQGAISGVARDYEGRRG